MVQSSETSDLRSQWSIRHDARVQLVRPVLPLPTTRFSSSVRLGVLSHRRVCIGTMLPSSVRRVVSSTAPPSSALSSFASAVPRAAAAYALSCGPGRHQRRCSSSKPSSPADGPKDIPAGESVPASSTRSTKSSGEKRGRKAREPQASPQKLPSVPSTQHLPLDSEYRDSAYMAYIASRR